MNDRTRSAPFGRDRTVLSDGAMLRQQHCACGRRDEDVRLVKGLEIMAIATLALTGLKAHGQERAASDDPSRVPVAERPRPEFEPAGVRLGAVLFYPKLLAGLRYDSNVYATEVDPQSDIAAVVSPQLIARYDSSRLAWEADVGADVFRFRRFTGENRVDAHARFRAQSEFAPDLKFETVLEAARRHELRGESSTPIDAATPVPYNDLRAEAAITKLFNRLGLTAGVKVRNLTYEDVDSFDGTLLDQTWRDGTIVTGTLKPFYEVAPGYRVYGRIAVNNRDYKGTGEENRDSDGYDLRGGVEFGLTPLISGNVEFGYLSQSYVNPQIDTVDGFAMSGKLVWLATGLTTVTAFADRFVSETTTPGVSARLDTTFGLKVDHELLRNLVLTAGAKFQKEDFVGSTRKDDVTKLTVGADYRPNPYAKLGVRYDYVQRDSTDFIYSFDRHVVMFNATAQY